MNFAIGLSGLHAASARLDRAADTIARSSANLNPVSRAAQTTAGVDASGQAAGKAPAGTPASLASRADGSPPAAEPDLVHAMVEQISASRAFMANVNSVQRTKEALDALIDTR
ncbi:MAG: hypothetical protein R3E83_24600 [Burkholderiaceae bacterium]